LIFAEECAKHGRAPRQSSCSYFIHITDDAESDRYGRETLLSYFKDALVGSFPSNPETVPPTLRYFLEIVKVLNNMKPEDLTNRSVLIGSPEKIIEDLRGIEASGISEVILYFNYGMKPHALVNTARASQSSPARFASSPSAARPQPERSAASPPMECAAPMELASC